LTEKRTEKFAYVFLIGCLLLFSSKEVVSKPIMDNADPFFVAFFRVIVGGAVLLPFINRGKTRAFPVPGLKDLLSLLAIGSFNSVLSITLLQLAVAYSNASTAATLVATSPIFVSLLAAVFLEEKPTVRKMTGTILGLVGIFLFSSVQLSGDSFLGVISGIGAAVSFAVYSVLLKKKVVKLGALACTAYSFFFSGILYGIVLALIGRLSLPNLDLKTWLLLIYLGAAVTGIGYYAFFESAKRIGAARTSRILYMKPVVATIFALLFLGEGMEYGRVFGMAVIVFSMFL
jgi:drug/metabolite transporter (DMT)-like permease